MITNGSDSVARDQCSQLILYLLKQMSEVMMFTCGFDL